MRRRTPKRAAEERRYLKRSREWLDGQVCAGYGIVEGCNGLPDTVQHLKGRRGALLLDERYWLALCWDPCHDWAEHNPNDAKRVGLAMSKVGA